MATVKKIEIESAAEEVKPVLEAVQQKMGMVPNIFKHMANSPAVLQGYLGLSEQLGKSSLSAQLREKIALIIAEENNCDYCLAAHTAIAKGVGLSDDEALQARRGEVEDEKERAIIAFAKEVVEKKGWPAEESISSLKGAGVSDQELVEIILVVAANIFTNYFNHIVGSEVDFPEVPAAQ